MKNTFNARLATRRKAAGLTQEILAKRLGITVWMYRRWEAGTAMPRADQLLMVCELLSTSMQYMAGRQDDPRTLGGLNSAEITILQEMRMRGMSPLSSEEIEIIAYHRTAGGRADDTFRNFRSLDDSAREAVRGFMRDYLMIRELWCGGGIKYGS